MFGALCSCVCLINNPHAQIHLLFSYWFTDSSKVMGNRWRFVQWPYKAVQPQKKTPGDGQFTQQQCFSRKQQSVVIHLVAVRPEQAEERWVQAQDFSPCYLFKARYRLPGNAAGEQHKSVGYFVMHTQYLKGHAVKKSESDLCLCFIKLTRFRRLLIAVELVYVLFCGCFFSFSFLYLALLPDCEMRNTQQNLFTRCVGMKWY